MSIQVIPAVRGRRTALFLRLWGLLTLAISTRRHRRTLRTLEPHLLRDIGLTEAEARREAERPFWDVPSHWRG